MLAQSKATLLLVRPGADSGSDVMYICHRLRQESGLPSSPNAQNPEVSSGISIQSRVRLIWRLKRLAIVPDPARTLSQALLILPAI